MVNYKYLGLPFLLGLFTVVKGLGTCTPSDSATWGDCKTAFGSMNSGYKAESNKLYFCTLKGSFSCIHVKEEIGYYKGPVTVKCSSTACIDADEVNALTDCAIGSVVVNTGRDSFNLCLTTGDVSNNPSGYVELFKENANLNIIIPDSFLDATLAALATTAYSISIGKNESLEKVLSTEDDYYSFYGTNLLLKCQKNSSTCVVIQTNVAANEGYYVTDDTKQLIYCNGSSTCDLYDDNIAAGITVGVDGYYVNKANPKRLISCKAKTGTLETGEYPYICTASDVKNGYYKSIVANKIIKCDENKCEESASYPGNGFYYNENYDSYVKCAGATCVSSGIENTSCTTTNKYMVVVYNKNLKYCNGSNGGVDIKGTTATRYYVVSSVHAAGLTYPDTTTFISTADGDKTNEAVLAVGKHSTALLGGDAVCIGSTNLEKECVEGDAQYRCATAGSKCTKVVKTGDTDPIKSCKPTAGASSEADKISCKGYYLYTDNNNNAEIYDCAFTSDTTNTCTLKKYLGYIKNRDPRSGSKPYAKCYYNPNNKDSDKIDCIGLSEPASGSVCKEAGDLIKSGSEIKLCVDDANENAIPLFTEKDATAFIPERILNPNAAVDSELYHRISTTATRAVLIKTSDQYDNGTGSGDTDDGLFDKENANTFTSTFVTETVPSVPTTNYYYNKKIYNYKSGGTNTLEVNRFTVKVKNGYYLGDEGNPTKKPLITCSNGECLLSNPEGIYKNEKDATKVIVCTTDVGCEYKSIVIVQSTPSGNECSGSGFVFINVDSVIKLCIETNSITTAKPIFESGITENIYIQRSKFNSIAKANEYYVMTIGEKEVLPINSPATGNYLYDKKVMECTSDSKVCKAYIHQGSYMLQGTDGKMIYCDANPSTGCDYKSVLGYYKKAYPNVKKNDYIKCTAGGCEEKEFVETNKEGELKYNADKIQLWISENGKEIDVFNSDATSQYLISASILNSTITDTKKYYLIEESTDHDVVLVINNKDASNTYGQYLYTVIPVTGDTSTQKQEVNTYAVSGFDASECKFKSMVEYVRDKEGNTYTKEEQTLTCETGKRKSYDGSKCVAKIYGCDTYSTTANTCTKCLSGYYLTSSKTSCCPSAKTNCAECNADATACTSCDSGYRLSTGTPGTCVQEISGCIVYDSSDKCINCGSGTISAAATCS